MPTINHSVMLSVDWLSVSLVSLDKVSEEMLSARSTQLDQFMFDWLPRKYGTKQFRMMWDISIIDDSGALEPFGVLCSDPTTENNDPNLCTLKLDNHLLYRDGRFLWLEILRAFLAQYKFKLINISRCDLAADFIFLKNRISGTALVNKLKTFEWWKCGSVKVSEHYKMPYEIAASSWTDAAEERPKIFLQNKRMAARVETLTFGTMSSDAQVCIYDKTLELRRSEVVIKSGDIERKESAKEYIRDCHKEAKVYDPKKHTWRIEIRLKSKALFLVDPKLLQERPLYLEDLDQLHLFATFKAAAAKYFHLVDASLGGSQEITAEYCQRMASHKNRLPDVELFTESGAKIAFTKKPYHEAANRFHRAVINRLDELGNRLNRVPCHYTKQGDAELIPELMKRLEPMAKKMQKNREVFKDAAKAIASVDKLLESENGAVPEEDIKLIEECKEMLERHLHTESPRFCRNMISMLAKYSCRMLGIDAEGTDRPLRRARSANPEDSQVLIEAAEILKAVYVDVVHDERRAAEAAIHVENFRQQIDVVNQELEPPAATLNYLYLCVESNRYLSKETIIEVMREAKHTDFFQLIRCNWDVNLWHKRMHHYGWVSVWSPPTIPPAERRPLTTELAAI